MKKKKERAFNGVILMTDTSYGTGSLLLRFRYTIQALSIPNLVKPEKRTAALR